MLLLLRLIPIVALILLNLDVYQKQGNCEMPPCSSKIKNVSPNQCIRNFWNSNNEFCTAAISENLPQCPEGFIDAVSVCYKIILKTTFPPKCPYQNILEFNLYQDLIDTLFSLSIWIPVRRDTSDGLGFLEWLESGYKYKTEFNDNYNVSGHIKNKNCLIRSNRTYFLVSCEDENSGICVYNKLNQVSSELCKFDKSALCHQADFDSKSKCFCLGGSDSDQTKYTLVEFLKPYQNKVYDSLSSDKCTIALTRQENIYIWNNTKRKVDYCYWSPETNFDRTHNIGAVTPQGWTLSDSALTCFLYELEVKVLVPTLKLEIDADQLKLAITNPSFLLQVNSQPLIFCFTDAGAFTLKYRYEIDMLIKIDDENYIMEKTHRHGPGNYWCEAFNAATLEVIGSDVVFFNSTSFGEEFVVIIRSSFIPGSDPLNQNTINFFNRLFSLTSMNDDYVPRIMKFIDIDEEENEVWLNIHFTEILGPNDGSVLSKHDIDEFSRIKNFIINTIKDVTSMSITMVDFFSGSYCTEDTNVVTWPRTKLNDSTFSKEFCFDIDGLQIKRLCLGNFIDGAQWEPINSCQLTKNTAVTEELLGILNNPHFLEKVHTILLRFCEFGSFDVFLIAKILKDNPNVNDLGDILDNLLKVNDTILAEAQMNMRAMDSVLEIIDTEIDNGDIVSKNLQTISDSIENMVGIVMINGNVVYLTQKYSSEKLIELYPNLEHAVWLDTHLDQTTKIIFVLYFNDNFFKDQKNVDINCIFGVKVPKGIQGTLQVLSKTNYERCAFWNYDLTKSDGRGFWKTGPTARKINSFIECSFNELSSAGFAIIWEKNNVTENLNDLVESINSDPLEIIIKLANISDRYDEFTSHDIYLVGKILEKICTDEYLDLQALAHIISNLHEIKRVILSNSQRESMATDLILHSVDEIIKNHNYTKLVNIVENNFMIHITDLKDDFCGLALFENETLDIQVLTGDITVEEVMAYKLLNSALFLSPNFKQQFPEGVIIKTTIFSSDGLFNENIPKSLSVSKIFGVIFSDDFDNFTTPLNFIYKVSSKQNQRSCVHWSYKKTENVPGLWEEDSQDRNVSLFSECKFWHTTHFALLLLDTMQCDNKILEWITTIGTAISMFGLLSIVLTAILFKRWRTNSGNQILLNFVVISIIQICLFYASTKIKKYVEDYTLCTIIGVVLHYSIISQFCWMFVIAVLQFKRFVEVLAAPPKHVLLKACLCGWLLPFLPVISVFVLDGQNYTNGKVGLCYPSGLGLYLGIWLPIAIVTTINCVIFIYIIYSVVHKKTECSDVGNSEIMFQWRLAILLFFMLGITWIFGFLSESALAKMEFACIFVYIFCITATVQGFVMFLFFIVFNANTRYLYLEFLKHKKKY